MNGLQLSKKHIAIIGFGVSGFSVARYFLKHNIKVTVFEDKKQNDFKLDSIQEFIHNSSFSIFFADTVSTIDILEYDYVIASPGVPRTHSIIQKAISSHVEYVTDINAFLRIFRYTYPKGKVVSVTGSNGKSTTVSMLYEALQSAQHDVYLGGNIGISPLDFFEHIKTDTPIIILETSSYQLEYMKPEDYFDVACILNLSDNHLNRYGGSKELYAKAKLGGIHSQYTTLILNFDDLYTQKYIMPHVPTKNIIGVDFEHTTNQSVITCENNAVRYTATNTIYVNNVQKMKLKGIHNVYNCAFVCAVLHTLDIQPNNILEDTIYNFSGLRHRIQYVDIIQGVTYINDSKSTSPDATQKALQTIGKTKNIILISGGNDKDISYDAMQEGWSDYVKGLILLPGTANIKLKNLAAMCNVEVLAEVLTMKDAFICIQKYLNDGDIVLLSPATDSHASFTSFEDRGNQFIQCVKELKK